MILKSVLAGRVTVFGSRWRRIPSVKQTLVRSATGEGRSDESLEGTQPSTPTRRIERPPPRPIPPGMKLERVERLGEESWGGVAKVDKTTLGPSMGLTQKLILATGDIVSLTAFATIGRASHHEALSLVDSLGTAAPFIIGWVGASSLLGGYTKSAIETPLKTAATAWITGIPAGLLVRSLVKGHLPETTFVAISMAFTGLFLMGWRSAYGKFLAGDAAAAGAKARSNRRGNPFEFLSLLASLTKRW